MSKRQKNRISIKCIETLQNKNQKIEATMSNYRDKVCMFEGDPSARADKTDQLRAELIVIFEREKALEKETKKHKKDWHNEWEVLKS